VGEQAAVRWHENDEKNRRDLEVYLKAMIATQAAADAQADADVEVP
jgi:hypothetical protein